MGYITLAQTAEARAETLPKSGNVEGATVAVSPLGGVTVRVATTPRAGPRDVCAQIVADALGASPEDVQVVTDMDTSTSAWSCPPGTIPPASPAPRAPSTSPHVAAKAAAIREHLDDELSRCDVWRGRALARQAYRSGMEPGLHETAFCAIPNLEPPDEADTVASFRAHGFIADVAVVEVDRQTGEVRVLDYVTVHDAGRLLNPLLAEGQIRGGFAHGAGAGSSERVVMTTTAAAHRDVHGLPGVPRRRPQHRDAPETPSPFTPLGARGSARATR